eukprot:tig00000342_g24197.t1
MGKRERPAEAPEEQAEGGELVTDAPEVPAEVGQGAPVCVRPGSIDPQLLKFYYKRLFPYKSFYRWLTYGKAAAKDAAGCDEAKFPNREFCFTLDAGGGDEIFARYQSFMGPEDMQKAMVEKCPVKIDIGPIYSQQCSERKKFSTEQFKPVQRELVFDIDMTDYDDIRTCCKGADVCKKCWVFISCAIKVLDAGLREDFGFERIMWVYSGRRGVHCWVCDERARCMADDARGALAEYFALYKGSENNKNKAIYMTYPMHPSLARSLRLVEPLFTRLVEEQGYFDGPEQWERVLALIPDDAADLRDLLREQWQKEGGRSGVYRWQQFRKTIEHAAKTVHKKDGKRWVALRQLVEQVIFSHTYPRLDIHVSKKMNHLLKAPFCVHPKTGKVCVPIFTHDCENFDPAAVPTLTGLYEECLNEPTANAAEPLLREEYKKSMLREPIMLFHNSLILPFERAIRQKSGLASDDLF